MRVGIAIVALLCARELGAQVVAGQTTITLPDTSAYSVTARHLLKLEIERSAAIARHDTAWLAQLYAPDFKGVPAGGRLVDQSALMRVFTGDAPNLRFLIDELDVRDYEKSATVMGRLRTTTLAGDAVAESRYVHVWVERQGKWWIVAAVGSAVQPPPKQ
ncbi:MAG TPA: nuclear transport factor 2 family protein [Gemmatimonadaceae bacterium]|nr:nuclear transport factor 2 family protein [Gemmatimonadaceae bacterium]